MGDLNDNSIYSIKCTDTYYGMGTDLTFRQNTLALIFLSVATNILLISVLKSALFVRALIMRHLLSCILLKYSFACCTNFSQRN